MPLRRDQRNDQGNHMRFDFLKPYRVVLVTGPQRSGTTIATRVIAKALAAEAVVEERYGINDGNRWRKFVRNRLCGRAKAVIQCPAMCHIVHEFGDRDDLAVVFMRRPLEDIIASQDRIGWTEREEWRELEKYGAESGPIAEIKYCYWQDVQKQRIKHAYEVNYMDLSDSDLWAPKELRQGWGARQTA